MEKLYIAISIGLINFALMGYVTVFWTKAWRKYGSPAAHALAISSTFIAFIALSGSIGATREALTKDIHMSSITLFMSGFTLFYSVIQVMFTKGYFKKEKI